MHNVITVDNWMQFLPGGVFIVIFVGIALACITLLGEYWYYKYWKPSRTTSPTSNPKLVPVRPDPATMKTNFNTDFKYVLSDTHKLV